MPLDHSQSRRCIWLHVPVRSRSFSMVRQQEATGACRAPVMRASGLQLLVRSTRLLQPSAMHGGRQQRRGDRGEKGILYTMGFRVGGSLVPSSRHAMSDRGLAHRSIHTLSCPAQTHQHFHPYLVAFVLMSCSVSRKFTHRKEAHTCPA